MLLDYVNNYLETDEDFLVPNIYELCLRYVRNIETKKEVLKLKEFFKLN